MRETNSILEDICAEIGWGATRKLVAIYSGKKIYIPAEVTDQHPFAQLLGEPAFKRLVSAFGGGDSIAIPTDHEYDTLRLLPSLAKLIASGSSVRDIALRTGYSERQVRNLRVCAEEIGLLPVVVKAKAVDCEI